MINKTYHTVGTVPESNVNKAYHTVGTVPESNVNKTYHTIGTVPESNVNKTYHTVGTVPESNVKFVETEPKSKSLTHVFLIYLYSGSWYGHFNKKWKR